MSIEDEEFLEFEDMYRTLLAGHSVPETEAERTRPVKFRFRKERGALFEDSFVPPEDSYRTGELRFDE